MKILLREIRMLLNGLLFACLFMPALLWLLNFKHGIHSGGNEVQHCHPDPAAPQRGMAIPDYIARLICSFQATNPSS